MGRSTDRVTRAALVALTVALAGVYLFSAITMPPGHSGAAVAEAAIGAAEVLWLAVVAVTAVGPRSVARWPYIAGMALQGGLSVLWVLTRTVELPGVGRLPVGEFDLLCAADAVAIAVLCRRLGRVASARGPRPGERFRLGLCQLAVTLAAATAYMSMASVMSMSVPAAHARGTTPAATQFFCHLL
jgi:hypothetical protein